MNTTSSRRPGTSPKPRCRTGRSHSSSRRALALVVDDVECVRACITIILQKMAGARAVGAATSQEALELARRRKFDVVTSDITRCGMNGLEFLRIFKREHQAVPVIIISAALDEANIRRARWLRAFGCLPKPFLCRELVGLVRAAMASKKVCRTVLYGYHRHRRIP